MIGVQRKIITLAQQIPVLDLTLISLSCVRQGSQSSNDQILITKLLLRQVKAMNT